MSFMKDREADLREARVATEPGDKLDAFSEGGRRAILGLLVTLGDNKYKLGRRYSEWATSGPTLEASVAAASMTSDEMGHARSLYPLLRRFPDAPPELKKEDDREDFHNVAFLDRPFETWAELIAAASLFDRAMSHLVTALRESTYTPLRHRAEKILQEERYHALYANGWLEALAADEKNRDELRAAMNAIWTETLAWFGPEDDPMFRDGVEEKIVSLSGAELRGRFVNEIRETVEPVAGIGFPSDLEIPWEKWDATSRRLRG